MEPNFSGLRLDRLVDSSKQLFDFENIPDLHILTTNHPTVSLQKDSVDEKQDSFADLIKIYTAQLGSVCVCE